MGDTTTGQTDLSTLLAGLSPKLSETEYRFCLVEDLSALPMELWSAGDLSALIREDEGWTIIASKSLTEDYGLPGAQFPSAKITLEIHSSLEAVGMMAAVSAALTSAGISCNPIAGYHHDHLFVPYAQADAALAVITALSSGQGSNL